jgi:hypothetical protein
VAFQNTPKLEESKNKNKMMIDSLLATQYQKFRVSESRDDSVHLLAQPSFVL